MSKRVSSPSELRRSGRQREASKCQSSQQQQQFHYVLPARELKRDELHVSCLPPEVLTRVFRWLPLRDLGRVARVCAGWRDLVYHQSFWCDVTVGVNRKHHYLDRANLVRLLNSLSLRGIWKIDTNDHTVLLEITRHLPRLRDVSLYDYRLSPVSWSNSLLRQMTNLTRLNFASVRIVTDDSIQRVAEHLKKLVSLRVGDCEGITSRSMEYIAMGLPELEKLHLGYSEGIGDLGVGYLCGIGLKQPPAKLPQLKYLVLSFFENYTALSFHHMSAGQPYIRELHLFNLDNFPNAAFQWLATMRELRHLNISFTDLTGSGFVELANARSPITYLDLSCCESVIDKALEHVGRLKQLSKLVLDLTTISDAGFEQLVKGGDCPISTLSLSECDEITDEGMRHVAKLRQLRRLIFHVGDEGLGHLADAQSPVAFVLCSDVVTDVGLTHAARLPNLLSLNLSESNLITVAGLKEFVASVRGPLTELHLPYDYCSCLLDEVGMLECVARGLPNLTQLHVYTVLLNLEDILATARLLPRLHTLFLNNKNVMEEARNKFNGHVFQ